MFPTESDERYPNAKQKCEFNTTLSSLTLSLTSSLPQPDQPPPPSVKKQFIELPTSQWELKKTNIWFDGLAKSHMLLKEKLMSMCQENFFPEAAWDKTLFLTNLRGQSGIKA